jgi:hypothetical protein
VTELQQSDSPWNRHICAAEQTDLRWLDLLHLDLHRACDQVLSPAAAPLTSSEVDIIGAVCLTAFVVPPNAIRIRARNTACMYSVFLDMV